MWLISSKTFTNDSSQVQIARSDLNQALQNNALTIIVGNSLTRFSYLLQAHQNSDKEKDPVGWERAVKRILPELTPIGAELPFDNPTYDLDPFVIIQSVCAREEARQKLLDELNKELLPYTEPSPLHDLLVDLNPNAIVTTNYDLQIERAFARQHSNWEAIVRNAPQRHSKHTPIYKLNGSLKPDNGFESHYSFTTEDLAVHPETTVLISGADYNNCLSELKQSKNPPVIKALDQTLLIVGKSMSSLDLPFIAALRESAVVNPNRKAYYVSFGLSSDDRLNLQNLEIIPLHINMPETARKEHYYVGAAYALMNLFPDFANKYHDKVDEFADQQKLIRAPRFVALGLAAHNTIGRLQYLGGAGLTKPRDVRYMLPTQGRRNLRFEADEYPGGASLTTVKAFTSLDTECVFDASMISIVNEDDLFGKEILDFCEQSGINTDGISRSAEHTWHSTVIVHDGKSHRGIYPGQRIFMDRGFKQLALDKPSLEQLEVQLHPDQKNLRIVYFDKFLAQPYGDGATKGALVDHRHIFDDLITKRPDVDIIYETGGGGSRGLVVEKELNTYINILTASFPFFARYILPDEVKSEGELERFARDDFFTAEFEHETQAIEEMLRSCDESGGWFNVEPEWIEEGRKWVARDSSRRWLITTLHHYGALAIDLNTARSIYCQPSAKYNPPEKKEDNTENQREIQSTVGAGDVFRGAFCYALAKMGEEFTRKTTQDNHTLMRICTQFAVEIASEKCRDLYMSKAFDKISEIGEQVLFWIKEDLL
ncbi:hypothetical protein FACHB389_31715 [Nostoc calcicola FACHB-389]|nr:SIR2 family protein [Nostoc calcicola FACHB-3891]OKH21495.1 hypothetical protein FACHB389_31715 [Nostoc calcicola FACHB-389]